MFNLFLFILIYRYSFPTATNETQAYKATDFGCTDDALEWCRQQGGVVSYQQYSYISGPSVIAFGNKKAYCDMGTYTLIEAKTLASPFLTLAQLAYINPLADFTWNHTQYAPQPHMNIYIFFHCIYEYVADM